MKEKIVVSTNKLLHELFNYTFQDEDIKETSLYINNQLTDVYYVEFTYESSKTSSFKVRLSSSSKDNLRFTIYEKMLLYILISNARQSKEDSYFITMRKIRSIRGLKDNSTSTYNCYKMALERLKSKRVRLLPMTNSNKYKLKMIDCNILTIWNQVDMDSRITEFNYSFNDLDTSFVKNSQKISSYFNPFSFMFKKYYSFQMGLHLLRLIALNNSGEKSEHREFSYKFMLKQIHKVDRKGYIDNLNYYDYIATAKNKQSELLKRSYMELEAILKRLVKSKTIKSYSISERRTFKYLKDDEVKICIKFIR